jgi:hypothetical protein
MIKSLKTAEMSGAEVALIVFRLLSGVYRKGNGITADTIGIVIYLLERAVNGENKPEWEAHLANRQEAPPEISTHPRDWVIAELMQFAQELMAVSLGAGKEGDIRLQFDVGGRGFGVKNYDLATYRNGGTVHSIVLNVWGLGTKTPFVQVHVAPFFARCEKLETLLSEWLQICGGTWLDGPVDSV